MSPRLRGSMLLAAVAALGLLALVDPWEWRGAASARAPALAPAGGTLDAAPTGGPRLTGPGARAAPAAPPGAPRFLDGRWPASLDAMDPERDLCGVVVRPDGTPVAGARLATTSYPWRRGNLLTAGRYDEGAPGPTGTSAADGSFALRLAPGSAVALDVEAEGCAAVRLLEQNAGERVRVVVEPGVVLRLETVTADGVPAVGVRLEVLSGRSPRQALTSDAAGRAVSAPLVPTVTARVEVQVQPGWSWSSENVTLAAGAPTQDVRIVVARARTIAGRVTDATDGRPVAGARVAAGWTMEAPVTSGGDGRYVFPCWPSDGYRELVVEAPGYGREEVRVGEREQVDVALTRGGAVVGRVLGPGGAPVSGARVAAIGSRYRDGWGEELSLGDGETGADGRLAVGGLRIDLAHRLVVQHEGLGRGGIVVEALGAPGATRDVGDLRLLPGRTLAGRVLLGDGSPAPRIEVRAVGPAGSFGDAGAESDRGSSEEGRTDDRGRFRFADLPPGRYTLMAVEEEPLRTALEAELPAERDRLDLTLRLPPSRRLRFLPQDPEGRLVVPIRVELRWPGGRRETGLWDAGDLEVVIPGEARRVTVEATPIRTGPSFEPFLDPGRLPVPDDARELRIPLRRAQVISGTLLDEAGRPLARARVAARRAGEPVGGATTDESGAFRIGFEGSAPVDVAFDGVVYAASEDDPFVEQARPLAADAPGVAPGTTGVRLEARPAPADRGLTVLVLDPEGRPAEGLEVEAVPRTPGGPRTRTTGSDGRVEWRSLTRAPLALRLEVPHARRETWWPPAVPSAVPIGQVVEVRLRRPRLLEGLVVRGDGRPLAGAGVSAESGDAPPVSVTADARGAFRLPLDPDGPATVDLEAYGEDGEGGRWLGTLIDAPTGGAVRIVVAPHDGIVR